MTLPHDEDLADRLVDAETMALLAAQPTVDLTAELLPLVREASSLPWPATHPRCTVGVDRQSAPGLDGDPDIPLLLYRPDNVAPGSASILHIHGGGYVAGTAGAMEPTNMYRAAELGCVIVSVDYRLAPETPFPGPLHDCYAALRWMRQKAPELGIDPGQIGVMGESAGGGLAAGLALFVRDHGDPPLAFQHLVYPMLDDRTGVAQPQHRFAGRHVWTPGSNRFGWRSYLGTEPGGERVPYHAAAARCEDLAGLPPAYISTGALDLFVDEDLDYATRLSRAGVAVELHLYPGAVHGFDLLPGPALSERARLESLAALKRSLAGPPQASASSRASAS